MQKPLSEFVSLAPDDIAHLVESGPLLVTDNDEPQFIAQSLDSFEAMIRKIRSLETMLRHQAKRSGNVIPLRR